MIERQGPQPSAYDYSLGTTLQQWPLGHGRKQGRAQQWSHTTITGEPNPPSRLFVGMKPRDLASRWLWGIQHATEANQHTPDQISAMCGVMLGHSQSHVCILYGYIIYVCCVTKWMTYFAFDQMVYLDKYCTNLYDDTKIFLSTSAWEITLYHVNTSHLQVTKTLKPSFIFDCHNKSTQWEAYVAVCMDV